jgi:hypothetical protein
MAIAIKDAGALATKYSTRAAAAAPDYKAGVMNPKRSQSQSAIAAKDTWAQAVQQAATNGSYAKGLNKSGDAKWQQNASTVGVTRYPQGVQNAGAAWANGVTPYLQVLSGLTLPPRGVRGSPQNIQRVQAVNDALAKAKAAQSS